MPQGVRVLLIPGLWDSGPQHRQSFWQRDPDRLFQAPVFCGAGGGGHLSTWFSTGGRLRR